MRLICHPELRRTACSSRLPPRCTLSCLSSRRRSRSPSEQTKRSSPSELTTRRGRAEFLRRHFCYGCTHHLRSSLAQRTSSHRSSMVPGAILHLRLPLPVIFDSSFLPHASHNLPLPCCARHPPRPTLPSLPPGRLYSSAAKSSLASPAHPWGERKSARIWGARPRRGRAEPRLYGTEYTDTTSQTTRAHNSGAELRWERVRARLRARDS